MLSEEQIKKLSFLTEKIQECKKCKNLYINGMAVPFWTKRSRFLMIAEAPGKDEVREDTRTPLVGRAGRLAFHEIGKKRLGLKREDFLIVNTIQCRPVVNGRNGKPTVEEMSNCSFWVKKYLEVLDPKIILAFGGYSFDFFDLESGLTISDACGTSLKTTTGKILIPCFHPAALFYDPTKVSKFRKALLAFRKEMEKINEY